MDLTPFYEEFEKTCRIANFVVVFAFVVIIFICYRTIKDDSKECAKKWQKALCILGYCLILLCVLVRYVTGPVQCKKDIEQQTICFYEGDFEIVKTQNAFKKKATFLIEDEEYCLAYIDEEIVYDGYTGQLAEGKYAGKLVYGKHLGEILYLDIYWER